MRFQLQNSQGRLFVSDGIATDRRLSEIASKSHFLSKSILAFARHSCRAFALSCATAPDRTPVRQRALMIFDPNPIAHVDIAAAHRAFPEVLGLAQWRSGDLPSDDSAARKSIFDARNFLLMFRSKKIRPRIAPEARPIQAVITIQRRR